ncbi:MAG: ATP-binding protein [Patescibacteria group bacterium]
MDLIQNLDLLSVGITVASTIVLGFSVYFNDPKSITNKTFFGFTLVTAMWGLVNYAAYRVSSPQEILWLFRLEIFFGIWQAFFLLLLAFALANETKAFPKWYRTMLLPVILLTAVLTLTPYVFSNIEAIPSNGIPQLVVEKGIIFFGIIATTLVCAAMTVLIKRALKETINDKRRQLKLIITGATLMFLCIIIFNFVFPAFLRIHTFIPLGALFVFPFIAFTSYAILRHKLFDIKVAGASVLVFLLSIVTLSEIIFAQEFSLIIYRSIVFLLILIFGILLINTILKEVKIREHAQRLALDLEVANKDLKRLDEAKSDFISIASHQLRTPLSIIKGYISMMREGTFGELQTKIRDPLEKVYVSNERLITLVNDLLDLSRMERGRMQFDMKPAHLLEIVDPIVTDFQIVAKNKKMELVWEKDFKNDAISGDTNKLRQIALNLVDNAFKYTPSGKVVVKLTQEGDAIRFSVTDTGPGLSEEEARKLFGKFVRGKEQKAAHTEGLGLGLYVAKLIAEAHGGSIGATSPGKGKGSTFFILLPLEKENKA